MKGLKLVVAGIAIVFAVSMLFTASAFASTGWYELTIEDDFDDTVQHLITADAGDQWMTIGCDMGARGPNFFFRTIEFGPFNFINAGEPVDRMQAKFGTDKAVDRLGWAAWKSDGSKAGRTTPSRSLWQRETADLADKGTIAYRVTAYDGAQYTIQLPAPTSAMLDDLNERCKVGD